jgi:protein-tyrosine phosphatase
MAEAALAALVEEDPRLSGVAVSSAGTANWHVGGPIDPRATAALVRAGLSPHVGPAQFADATYLETLDLAVVMTREQSLDVAERAAGQGLTIWMLRELLGEGRLDLADPYYGDDRDFDECLAVIRAACVALAERLLTASN